MKKSFLIFSLICSTLITSCGSSGSISPKEQVRKVLTAIETATEERSLSRAMEYISDDYIDHKGYTKRDIKRLMQIHFLRNQNISVFTRVNSIEINEQTNPNTASVEVSAAMAARGVDLSLDSNRLKANTHRFSLVLTRQDETWLISSGSWQRGW